MRTALSILVGAALLIIVPSSRTFAHCDGLDGPVVQAAQEAIATGDVNPVLIWVQKKDEAEIRQAFTQAQAVPKTRSTSA